jgi:hypothetical protein
VTFAATCNSQTASGKAAHRRGDDRDERDDQDEGDEHRYPARRADRGARGARHRGAEEVRRSERGQVAQGYWVWNPS